ncbi:MAG: phosphomannomutase [Candidatus Berkelbacteria bacterium Licking1014_7]|uniref:Phosphomannomutase n=1 Tax=Candidatus Berkelbacteria bacterium Licking1014_7 TaxID=2017147 RepID=A0A554LJR0_9BACT|nr:MAG: phosphomannomutase [Candidatus Berkelbacteria bacterium Licking1014_7]
MTKQNSKISKQQILDTIVRAYDVRGKYPEMVNEEIVYDLVQGYIKFVKPKKVVVSRDVRESGPELQKAVIKSFIDSGVDVIDVGIVSTDMFYFAISHLGVDGGITVSASHNPAEDNGLNMAKKGAEPISGDSGLNVIKESALEGERIKTDKIGRVEKNNVLPEFVDFVCSFIDTQKIKPFKIIANPNCGLQGKIFQEIIKKKNLPVDLTMINGEPDGTFPQGDPNPLLPENREEICDLVKKEKADLGVSWDADGDRVFFVDELGRFIDGYYTVGVLAQEILKDKPGSTILIDPRVIWNSYDLVEKAGGRVIQIKPGMTRIPEKMVEHQAVFCGEMSGHCYFPENDNRDNGIIPLLLMLEMLSRTGKKMSQIYNPLFDKYPISGEINSEVKDIQKVIDRIKKKYFDGKQEFVDGLSVEYPRWRFNLRASNTEPVIRLNVESRGDKELVEEKTRELLGLIRK